MTRNCSFVGRALISQLAVALVKKMRLAALPLDDFVYGRRGNAAGGTAASGTAACALGGTAA